MTDQQGTTSTWKMSEKRWIALAGIVIATLGFLDNQLVSHNIGGETAMLVGTVLAALGRAITAGPALVLLVLSSSSCATLSSPQGQGTVQTITDTVICILNHDQEPIDKIAAACGAQATTDVITKILDAERAAAVRDGFCVPDAGSSGAKK